MTDLQFLWKTAEPPSEEDIDSAVHSSDPAERAAAVYWTRNLRHLRLLSTDPEVSVRCAVAKSPLLTFSMVDLMVKEAVEKTDIPTAEALLENPLRRYDNLAAMAENPELRPLVAPVCRPPLLDSLLLDEDDRVVAGIARNPYCPPSVLAALSTSENTNIRCSVASNLNTPVDILTALADDESPEVRSNLADNPRTPADALIKIIMDDSPSTQRKAMWNPNVDSEVAAKALLDGGTIASYVAAGSEHLPDSLRDEILADPEHPQFMLILGHAKLTEEQFTKFAVDPNPRVRAVVAGNLHISDALLLLLTHDENEEVAQAALVPWTENRYESPLFKESDNDRLK